MTADDGSGKTVPGTPDAGPPDALFSKPLSADLLQRLGSLDKQGLRRRLRRCDSAQGPSIRVGDCMLCCLCSNDYLELAGHPEVVSAVKSAVEQWGWGAGASRLVSGHMAPHSHLEEAIAAFKGTPAALVCPTGYQANLAAIRALAGPDDQIFVDRLDHASIIDAARGSGARLRVFPHRDYDRLERLLSAAGTAGRRLILTDSLFSMDGDFADLPRLVELKKRYDALLCIDEAHATGVWGESGRGLAEMMQVEHQIDVVVGTLSKALGGMGGYIAASRPIIDWIINTAGPFIYTTAIPPAACAAAAAALRIVASEEGRERRRALAAHAQRVRNALTARGHDPGRSTSQIIPIMVGEPQKAVDLSRRLEVEGFYIPAIRPPTVPRSQARLRLSLSCGHRTEDLDRFLDVLDAAIRAQA